MSEREEPPVIYVHQGRYSMNKRARPRCKDMGTERVGGQPMFHPP